MIESDPSFEGTSGDFGWVDRDERQSNSISTPLLLVVSCTYWSLLWLFSGLVPLSWIARDRRVFSHMKRNRP